MLRRISVGIALTGIGYGIAETPSVWMWVSYLIPVFAFSLLVAIIIKIFRS